MEPLKEMFNRQTFESLAAALHSACPTFERKKFVAQCMSGLESLSLNERMRRTAGVMGDFLPADFRKALPILKKAVQKVSTGYTTLIFPEYIARFGMKHFNESLEALAYFTRFGSSEFAIREFLKADFDRTLKVMYRWAKSDDHHIRRLASEGSRPRLPWSFKLDRVIAEPDLTRPILEALNADPELYVRKSVANHLNDISKFDPAYLQQLFQGWDKSHPHTAWIIRHACRSLIKKGDQSSLQLLDFEKSPRYNFAGFSLSANRVQIGEKITFAFQLTSGKPRKQKLAIDYAIHYKKQRGHTRKVFKLKELTLLPGTTVKLAKSHSFEDRSTRRHFPGKHLVEIQINGKVVHQCPLRLLPG